MNVKTLLLLLVPGLIFSCSRQPEEKTAEKAIEEMAQERNGSVTISIDDTVAKQMMETMGLNGSTFQDMMGTDSLEKTLMAAFSEDEFQKMLAESNLTVKEQQEMMRKLEEVKENSNSNPGSSSDLQEHTAEKMSGYFAELRSVLEASGSEQQLNDLQAMMEKSNTNDQIAALSSGKEKPQIENLRKGLGTNEPTYIEEQLTSYSIYGNAGKKEAMQKLASASESEVVPILAEYYKMSEKEVNMLKQLPASRTLTSANVAREVMDYSLPEDITTYLANGKPSDAFRYTTNNYIRDNQLDADLFLKQAAVAKDEFYKLNPGWYGEGGKTGDTYLDSRHKMIYLPLGDLSFADVVVSHELGDPQGSHKEGSIGKPDMSTERFDHADIRVCNLGIRGVLTLSFTDNTLVDVAGPDLYIFEMGAIEPTNLEISKDGKTWIRVGKIEGGTAKVDIAEFVKPGETFNYVRLTDLASFSQLPGADVDAVAAIGGAVRLSMNSEVLFATGKYTLKEGASDELQKLIDKIREFPKAEIVVEGHTDDVGSPESNRLLSENRAKEVAAYLKQKLSDNYNLKTRGYGESQPVVPNDNDENRQKNRRVEILVMPH